MLNFHYHELPLTLTNYLLLIYCRVCLHLGLHSDQWRSAGSGVTDRDPQNIWNSQKNCGSFVDAIVGNNK